MTMLKSQSEVEDEIKIVIDGKKSTSLDIKLKIRKAIVEQEFETKEREVMKMTKVYPEFKLSSKTQEGVVPEIKAGQNVAATPQQTSAPKAQRPAQPAKPGQKAPAKPQPKAAPAAQMPAGKVKGDFSSLSEADKKDPDNEINFLCSISVMEFKIKQMQQKIDAIEGRTPRELRQKLLSLKCKKNFFENAVGDGTISPQQVLDMQKAQLQKDNLLIQYFTSIGDAAKAQVVKERLPLLMQDIKDMEDIVKGG